MFKVILKNGLTNNLPLLYFDNQGSNHTKGIYLPQESQVHILSLTLGGERS